MNRYLAAGGWDGWAGLANTARDAVLCVATCRKAATDLAKNPRQPPTRPPGGVSAPLRARRP